jgi:hypothetical protein
MTALPNVPILPEIVRQHAEMAAFLWTVYDRALLYPDENLEMDATALADLVGRLEAHLDGLRIAGADGVMVAEERFKEFPGPGELFVVRILQPGAEDLKVAELDLDRVRAFLRTNAAGH